MSTDEKSCYNICINQCQNKYKLEQCNNNCLFLNKTDKTDETYKKLIDNLNDDQCTKIINKKILNNTENPITDIEEQILFIKINELKHKIEQYTNDEHFFETLLKHSSINIQQYNLKFIYKEIIKLLELTLAKMKKEYIPEPIIDSKKISDEKLNRDIEDILSEIKYLIIYNKLKTNNTNLYNLLIDIINSKNNIIDKNSKNNITDKLNFYNCLNDIYVIIINDDNYDIKIKKILELSNEYDFLENLENFKNFKKLTEENIKKVNSPQNNIFNIMKDFIEMKETIINNNLSNINFYNIDNCCYISSALQFLYTFTKFKQYIYNINLKNTDKLELILDNMYKAMKNNINIDFNEFKILQKNLTISLPLINNIDNFNNYYKPLLIIYIIKIIFNKMGENTKISKLFINDIITTKYVPLLRILLTDNQDYSSIDESKNKEYTTYKKYILKIDKNEIIIYFDQADSSECINKILDKTLFEKNSFVKDIIQYEIKNGDKTERINSSNNNFELYNTIYLKSLSKYNDKIPKIYDLLDDAFNTSEILDDFNYLSMIKSNRIITSKIMFNDKLDNLIFIINRNNRNESKITTNIKINKIIDIKNYMCDLSEDANTTYKLKSIIVHTGDTIKSGHYYIYIYNNDKLIIYDDTKKSITEPPEQLITQIQAYVLNYEKIK